MHCRNVCIRPYFSRITQVWWLVSKQGCSCCNYSILLSCGHAVHPIPREKYLIHRNFSQSQRHFSQILIIFSRNNELYRTCDNCHQLGQMGSRNWLFSNSGCRLGWILWNYSHSCCRRYGKVVDAKKTWIWHNRNKNTITYFCLLEHLDNNKVLSIPKLTLTDQNNKVVQGLGNELRNNPLKLFLLFRFWIYFISSFLLTFSTRFKAK